MRRPTSPFLLLLLGGAVTALVAEWLRFQAGASWAALPLGTGAVLTLAAVGRAYRGRRAWRAWQTHLAEEAAHQEAARAAAATRRADELREAGRANEARTAPSNTGVSDRSPPVDERSRDPRPDPQLGVPHDRSRSLGTAKSEEGDKPKSSPGHDHVGAPLDVSGRRED